MKEYLDAPMDDHKAVQASLEKVSKDALEEGPIEGKESMEKNRDKKIEKEKNEYRKMIQDEEHSLFDDINPLGLPLPEIKKGLTHEIEELEMDIYDVKKLSVSNEEKNKKINLLQQTIGSKKLLVKAIDSFRPAELPNSFETEKQEILRNKKMIDQDVYDNKINLN